MYDIGLTMYRRDEDDSDYDDEDESVEEHHKNIKSKIKDNRSEL